MTARHMCLASKITKTTCLGSFTIKWIMKKIKCNVFCRQNTSESVDSLESLNKQDVAILTLHKIKRAPPITTDEQRSCQCGESCRGATEDLRTGPWPCLHLGLLFSPWPEERWVVPLSLVCEGG